MVERLCGEAQELHGAGILRTDEQGSVGGSRTLVQLHRPSGGVQTMPRTVQVWIMDTGVLSVHEGVVVPTGTYLLGAPPCDPCRADHLEQGSGGQGYMCPCPQKNTDFSGWYPSACHCLELHHMHF